MKEKHHLSKNEIDAMEPVNKQHFLNEKAVRITRSLGDSVGLAAIGAHLVELEPGAESTEYHFHHDEEEFVYILEGTGTAIIGEETIEVGAGDFIGFPLNDIPHTMTNTGSQRLKYLMVGQRLPHDVVDYPRKGKRLYRHNGNWNITDLAHLEDPRK